MSVPLLKLVSQTYKQGCASCGYRKGVDPERGTCDDCARRAGEMPYDGADASSWRTLSMAVIRQAVADVATHVARHGQHWEKASYAADARDFLLSRMWEPGTHWADMVSDLLHPGMRFEFEKYCAGVQVRRSKNRWKNNTHLPAQWRVMAGTVTVEAEPEDAEE